MTGSGVSSPLSHDQVSVIDCVREMVKFCSQPSFKFHIHHVVSSSAIYGIVFIGMLIGCCPSQQPQLPFV